MAVKGIPLSGGIEKLTEEIGSRLVKKGHEALVYTSRDEKRGLAGFHKEGFVLTNL